MSFPIDFQTSQPVAYTVAVLAMVAVLGLALGSIKIRGIGLGIAGVLFAGILFGHLQFHIDPAILGFIRDLGLIVFVYTIGIQVGPGFFASLRRGGLPLNLMSAGVVLLGAGITLAIAWLGKVDITAAAGLLAGATTNTPSLGAAQEALHTIPGLAPARLGMTALGYAVAYPFGVVGIILAMLIIRAMFRIDAPKEAELFQRSRRGEEAALERMNLVVENVGLQGLSLRELPALRELGITVSRLKSAGAGEVCVAHPETVLGGGDVILAIGTRQHLDQFRAIVGSQAPIDLLDLPGPVTAHRIFVTRKDVLGKSLGQLGFDHRYGVTVTRISRADVELTAAPELRLVFGDIAIVVGSEAGVAKVGEILGNSVKALNHTDFIPVFVGIGLGVLVGLYPIRLGSMPSPVRLGLAGGPLITAIILSQIGRIGPLVWHMPANANAALREFGIILFLACVGLKAGDHFVEVLVHGSGLSWMAYGALITFLPLIIMGSLARFLFKQNFVNICGMLAGSMTDPPALAFANSIGGSDAPSIAYATVYPLTMVLRILVVQLIIIFFCH